MSEPLIGLTRLEDSEQAAGAIRQLWGDVPVEGAVALIAMPVGPQGETGARATPLWLIEAAAKHLMARGATVRVVCVPERLDEGRMFAESVRALEAVGLEVVVDPVYRDVTIGGEIVSEAAVLTAVSDAQHVAVISSVAPHRHLTLSSPLLAVADALAPNARHAFWAAAGDASVLRLMLGEVAASLDVTWALAWLGDELRGLVWRYRFIRD